MMGRPIIQLIIALLMFIQLIIGAPVHPLTDTCDDLYGTCLKGCRYLPDTAQDQCASICKSAREICKKVPGSA